MKCRLAKGSTQSSSTPSVPISHSPATGLAMWALPAQCCSFPSITDSTWTGVSGSGNPTAAEVQCWAFTGRLAPHLCHCLVRNPVSAARGNKEPALMSYMVAAMQSLHAQERMICPTFILVVLSSLLKTYHLIPLPFTISKDVDPWQLSVSQRLLGMRYTYLLRTHWISNTSASSPSAALLQTRQELQHI